MQVSVLVPREIQSILKLLAGRLMHSRDSRAYQNNFTIRNTAEVTFEWHASRLLLDPTLKGELEHSMEEKAMSSVRLDGLLGKK
jgi:hypothetical protein